jgi:undecaprenyl-diphosphatase
MTDLQIVLAFQHFVLSLPGGAAVAIFCAKWLIFLEGAIAAGFLLSKKRLRRAIAGQAAIAMGLALIIVSAVGHLVLRARPYATSSLVQLLISPPLKSSFPSGHTSSAFAMAFVIFSLDRRVGIIALVLASFVAMGRVASGVHFPTDILGGILVGALSALIIRALHRDVWERYTKKSSSISST